MSELAVVDASPLIILSISGRIDLLRCAAERIVVPRTVESEVLDGASDRRTIETLRRTPWIEVVAAPRIPARVAAWDLGAGESEVLAAALDDPNAVAVIDDRAARRCAQALRVPLIGTIGIVVRACRLGVVPPPCAPCCTRSETRACTCPTI